MCWKILLGLFHPPLPLTVSSQLNYISASSPGAAKIKPGNLWIPGEFRLYMCCLTMLAPRLLRLFVGNIGNAFVILARFLQLLLFLVKLGAAGTETHGSLLGSSLLSGWMIDIAVSFIISFSGAPVEEQGLNIPARNHWMFHLRCLAKVHVINTNFRVLNVLDQHEIVRN